jgi:hypothetical protein
MKLRQYAAALALAASIIPAHALAWGAEGHRIIAALAYERLTPAARQTVDQLIALAAKDTGLSLSRSFVRGCLDVG